MAAPTQVCGLINAASGKYLTGEKFGFTININGSSIKSKQIWQICSKEGSEHVFLRSPHNRYLAATEKGVVTADAEDMSGNAAFFFEPQPSGRVAFKSVHNYYFGGSGDQLSCFSKTAGDQESWIIHLANHPQFSLKNQQRKRYVVADAKASELRTTEEFPWGPAAVITVEFERDSGSYLLRAFNNQVLSQSGKLVNDVSDDTRFQLEFRSGFVAFRSKGGKYLSGVGSSGALQAKREKCDKEELFALEDSLPQVHLVSSSGKFVSIARGLEVSAHQSESSNKETFQLTWAGDKVALRSATGKFLNAAGSSILDNGEEAAGDCLYDLAFNGATVSLKAANGKMVITKPNGTLSPTGDADSEKSVFTMNIVNRPLVVLRGEHGFISTVTTAKDLRYECNRSAYEVLRMDVTEGVYTLTGASGKAVSLIEDSKTFAANGGDACKFHVEVLPGSKIAFRVAGGDFIKGVSNGTFSATASSLDKETAFEC